MSPMGDKVRANTSPCHTFTDYGFSPSILDISQVVSSQIPVGSLRHLSTLVWLPQAPMARTVKSPHYKLLSTQRNVVNGWSWCDPKESWRCVHHSKY